MGIDVTKLGYVGEKREAKDMEKHPLSHLTTLMSAHGSEQIGDAVVDLKVYRRPLTSSDMDPQNRPGYYERRTVTIQVGALARMSLEDLMFFCGAESGDDISMGNRLKIPSLNIGPTYFSDQSKYLWYPQMDFQTPGVPPEETGYLDPIIPSANGLQSEIGEQAQCALSIYHSGRSFHGYGTNLMSYNEWVGYMGRMLLLNNPTRTDVVDPRWIGKSLVVGQSYLRLTANCDQYKRVPVYVHNVAGSVPSPF